MHDAFRAFWRSEGRRPGGEQSVQDNDMIFLHPVELGLGEGLDGGVGGAEALDVQPLQLREVVVGEIGVVRAAADTRRGQAVMQVAVRADPARNRLVDAPHHTVGHEGVAFLADGGREAVEENRLGRVVVERGVRGF